MQALFTIEVYPKHKRTGDEPVRLLFGLVLKQAAMRHYAKALAINPCMFFGSLVNLFHHLVAQGSFIC